MRIVAPLLLCCCGLLPAAQFTINPGINGPLDGTSATSSWSGTNPLLGYVGDGGFDAFDGYGYLRNLNGLTVQRQVDALVAQNTWRWLDIFTNPTGATVTRTVEFYGDLGSDNRTRQEGSQPGLLVSSDRVDATDPVIAHVAGFTTFAGGSIAAPALTRVVNTNQNWNDDYLLRITLTLAPGESAGILHFAALARDTAAPRDFTGDVALATTMGQNLLANPILTGLTTAQIGTIRNFATPEPATLALLAVGAAGLALVRRRRVGASS